MVIWNQYVKEGSLLKGLTYAEVPHFGWCRYDKESRASSKS